MNKFKEGSVVKWNGKTDSEYLSFYEHKEEFLKSKEEHTISEINNEGYKSVKLEGDIWWYDLTWLELVKEEPKEFISKQRKIKVLEEHKEWLESKMKSHDSLELRKELVRVKLAIINLEDNE